jgi:transposase InsO family protein/predicted aspartyl protease
MSLPLTFRNRCVETAGGKSVKCVQSRENSLSVVNPSLNLCNDSQVKCVQFVSDKVVPLDELKFPSHMRVVCKHSIDVRECRMCDVSERVLLSDVIVNVSSQNLCPSLSKSNEKIDIDIPRCVRHDKYAQTVESCSNPFFLEVYRKMNPCVVRRNCYQKCTANSRETQTEYLSASEILNSKFTDSMLFRDSFENSRNMKVDDFVERRVNLNDSMSESELSCCSSMSSITFNSNVQLEGNLVSHCDKETEPKCNLYGGSIWLMAIINGRKCPVMIDTGSAISIFNHSFDSRISPCDVKAMVANGDNMKLNGIAELNMRIGSFDYDMEIFIAPEVSDNLIGLDVLKKLKCSIDLINMKLIIQDEIIPLYNTTEIGMIALINSLPVACESQSFQLPETISSQIASVPAEYRGDVVNLLMEYAELFRTEPLGTSRRFEHRIELMDPEPIRMMPRRVPLTQYQPMLDEVERMLRLGVIRKSVSPYASPIVLVKKKSGEIRFCVDFRKLNEVTVKDAFPLPHVSDVLEALHGAKFFTTLDLSSGFWQIRVREKDVAKTAFCIQNGHYEFLKMPFGLCNSVSTFQRAMAELLEPMLYKGAVVFVDDIVVYSDTIPGLMARLRRVFDLLRSDNLTLHPGKCVLFKTEVKVLGHRVSAEGIRPLNDKVEVVESWPTPKNKRELRAFIGLCSYYRQYVADFAKIAAPLHKLTGKNAQWQWTDRECESFSNLKQALQTTPVLQLFDPNKPVMVDCDSSGYALGGVLVQPDGDNNEKPVAYFSRCLNKAEASYCITRKELLSILVCLRHWKHYLIGRKIIVRTDHSSLTWLRSFKQPESQLARWFSELSQFDIQIVHRPGNKSANADGLSRRPCIDKCTHCQRRENREEELCVRSIQIQSEFNWSQEQRKDPDLARIIAWKERDVKPCWEEVSGGSPVLKRLWKEWDVLVIQDSILRRVFFKPVGEKFQTVIPIQCRSEITKLVHEQGHFGIMRTQISLSDRFYWPCWRSDVRKLVGKCHQCNSRKGPHEKVRLPERKYLTSEAFERIAVDICGPLPETKNHNRYMLVVTDYFSKWVEPLAIKNQEAETVASALINEFIARYGCPTSIYSDRGAQFTSRLVKIICDRLHIQKVNTCPYRPSSNGQCERSNRSLIDALSKVIQNEKEWDKLLPLVGMYYRASTHRATGVSPALLALGRDLRLPVDVMYPTGPVERVSMPEYLERMEDRMTIAAEFARHHMEMDWQSRQSNRSFWNNYRLIDVNKQVYVFRPVIPRGTSFKLAKHWWGPYHVKERINDHLYRVDMGGRNGVQVIHRAHLFQPCDIEDIEEETRNLPCRRQNRH